MTLMRKSIGTVSSYCVNRCISERKRQIKLVLSQRRGRYELSYRSCLLSLHLLCGDGDLLFLLSPPAATATCFCSHSKTPTQIISKYLQYVYWPWGICLVIFFAFFSFFNNIQDGRQNPMAHARA